MNTFVLALVIQLLLGYATLKIIQKYLPDLEGKFLDADGYVLLFGEGLLVIGIIKNQGISFVFGLILTLCAVGALFEKYRLRRKGQLKS